MIFPEKVIVTDQEIDLAHVDQHRRDIYVAEAKHIYDDWKKSGATRRVVGIAGPSGAGKSVYTAVVKKLIAQIDAEAKVLTLTIDAYHFGNALLRQRGIDAYKGRYDTYDVGALVGDITKFKKGEAVAFPSYSRKLHEPILEGESISADTSALLLVEGLWLLFDEFGWGEVSPLLDRNLFLEEAPETLRTRTISRHVRGGRTAVDAEHFYDMSDLANTALVMGTKANTERVLIF